MGSIKKLEDYSKNELRSWRLIHTNAFMIKSKEDLDKFNLYIEYMLKNLPCGSCRTDAKRYITLNPIPTVVEDKNIFKWTWEYHNYVNKKLRKPEMEWDTVVEIYFT